MKTLITLLLDRSGSMSGRESDVVGGVNSFIRDQQKIEDPSSLRVLQFDSIKREDIRPLQDLQKVVPLGEHEFKPRAGTPLFDAIGHTMDEMDQAFKAGGFERGILVIITDGQENSSSQFTKAQIKERITRAQESGKWAVVYLGADVDAFQEATQMGVNLANAAGYTKTARGMDVMWASASASVSSKRMTGDMLRETTLHVENLGENKDSAGK